MADFQRLPPIEGWQRPLVTVALAMAVFMQILDTTIANVAIPTISGNLGASVSQGTWVITSFGVANAISVPISGWLARRIGEVRLFLISTIGFVVTSWLCGMSSSLGMLIFFRVLQGLLAGPMMPLSQSLLLSSYPDNKKSMALALWAMTVVVAPIFGPILGGWISDEWHWSWIFFINVPIGVLTAVICWLTLRHRETRTLRLPVDRVGLFLLVIGVGSLQLMLDRGKELDWFNSTEIIVLAVLAAMALIYLAVWEWYDEHPIIDLKLFRSRNFAVGTLTVSAAFMVYFGLVVLIPLLLQTQMGYTATQAGLATAPIGILPVFMAPVIGRFGHRVDMRLLLTLSFMIFSATFFWRTTFEPGMDMRWVVWPQFVQGFAVGMFFLPLTTISLSELRLDQIAAAASLFNFFRTLAGSIGTSLVNLTWDRREALHHTQLVERINPFDPATQQVLEYYGHHGIDQGSTLALLVQDITRQGYFIAADEIFYLNAFIFLLLIALIWMAKPPFHVAGRAAASDGH